MKTGSPVLLHISILNSFKSPWISPIPASLAMRAVSFKNNLAGEGYFVTLCLHTDQCEAEHLKSKSLQRSSVNELHSHTVSILIDWSWDGKIMFIKKLSIVNLP